MPEPRFRYDVDQVRERTDLLALVGTHVALKKRGGKYTGLCPFHQEKTPSFTVDPQKGFWHCFGCGKGGDAITFAMQMEHLAFGEALEKLAERAGVRPEVTAGVSPQRKEERDFLFEANAVATAAFEKALAGKAGAAARAYLAARGIDAAAAQRFGLGYAPAQWDSLAKHLTGRGYAGELLAKAGLVMERTGGGYVDRFRNRLMVPIHDRQGRPVGFGGRALAKEDNPKYLNTAETAVFHKNRTLYLLHMAADAIVKRGRALITEGYFDAIACHLGGFPEAVATLGTALGEEHVQILRRLAERVYLVYDADSAGVNAALRSQALFREAGVDVRIVRLPGTHDPDTFLREEGADAFERALANALSPVEFEIERLIATVPADDATSRVRLFREAARLLLPLPPLERAEFARFLVDRYLGPGRSDASQFEQAIMGEVTALARAAHGKATPAAPAGPTEEDEQLEREVLRAMVQDAAFAACAVAAVPPDAFTQATYRALFSEYVRLAAAGTTLDARAVVADHEEVAALVSGLAMRETLEVRGQTDREAVFAAKQVEKLPVTPDMLLAQLHARYEVHRLTPDSPAAFDDADWLRAYADANRRRSRQAEHGDIARITERGADVPPFPSHIKKRQ
jgi:DNA primase